MEPQDSCGVNFRELLPSVIAANQWDIFFGEIILSIWNIFHPTSPHMKLSWSSHDTGSETSPICKGIIGLWQHQLKWEDHTTDGCREGGSYLAGWHWLRLNEINILFTNRKVQIIFANVNPCCIRDTVKWDLSEKDGTWWNRIEIQMWDSLILKLTRHLRSLHKKAS